MQATKPRILTARLNLTRINKEHEGALSAILSDPEVMYAWEIGYGFAKQFWHNGYAAEAAKACKLLAFSLNISEVYSIIRTNNLPSIRVAERNGMSPVGTVIKHYRGKVMPHTVFKTSI